MANIASYRTKAGTRWMADIRLKGVKRTSQGEFLTRRDAKEWANTKEAELRAARDRGGAQAEVGTITVREFVRRFLADPTISQLKWRGELEDLLAVWTEELGDERVRSVGREQIKATRDKLLARRVSKAKTMSPARVNRHLAALRRAWSWGTDEGYVLASNPWPANLMLTEPDAKEVLASLEELHAMFTACDRESPLLGSLVRFLTGTGCRLGDALLVRWKDVDQSRGDLAIRGTKTGKPLRVAMLAPALEALELPGRMKNVNGLIFWQYPHRMAPRHHWLRARKNFPAHMRTWRLHDLRHACASLLAANGATTVELAHQLGHSTLAMVKRYAHLGAAHRGEAHKKLDKALARR